MWIFSIDRKTYFFISTCSAALSGYILEYFNRKRIKSNVSQTSPRVLDVANYLEFSNVQMNFLNNIQMKKENLLRIKYTRLSSRKKNYFMNQIIFD